MKIKSVIHKGLRRFIEDGDAAKLDPQAVEKLRRILSYLAQLDDIEKLKALPQWRAHQLKGDRKGTWSLSVTANWRLTFKVRAKPEPEIFDLDFEDYH
jgi:proteic killer suppression protein